MLIRFGTDTVNRTVLVEVSTVRPESLGNVSVSVNGEQRHERGVQTFRRGPVEAARVPVRVKLTERVANVTVSVTDDGSNSDQNRRGRGRSGSGTETTGSATLLLDGDGLNESTERRLGTDPLDPDSDSSETPIDESDNGTIDGREDFDGDGLGTLQEFEAGTDPLNPDTDGDQLQDGVEYYALETSPLDPDTDDDGTNDGNEDPDGDTLTTSEEVDAGTLPWLADTDGDGLDDAEELDRGTDPLHPDTDEDFLFDAAEIEIGTDPQNPDTNDNGVVDGNETYTTTAENETLGATVEVTGEGNVAGRTTVRSPRHVRFTQSYAPNVTVAPFVEFESDRNFSSAEITIEYDESRINGSEENLSIYRFNESRQGYEPLNSTIDTDANTVSAETTHFSTYTVFENDAWVEHVRTTSDLLGRGNAEQYTNYTFESPPDSFNESEWSCELGFDPYYVPPDVELPDECSFDRDNNTLYIKSSEISRTYVNRSLNLPDENPLFIKIKADHTPRNFWGASELTLQSDNETTYIYRDRIDVQDSEQWGEVRRINITHLAGETVTISGFTSGWAISSYENYSRLDIHYIDIEAPSNATVTTDSDGDGIPDYREVLGIPLANGPTVHLDPNDPDTDGDGIPDGEEVNISSRVTQETPDGPPIQLGYEWSSDPTTVHTDSDGISDKREEDGWTVETINRSGSAYQWAPPERESNGTIRVDSNPKTAYSDSDGLSDRNEKYVTHTDPSGDVTYDIAGTIDGPLVVNRVVENSASTSDLFLGRYYSIDDDDQDGIIDSLEERHGIPVQTEDGFGRMELDDTDPDVDGDGLLDSQEFESYIRYERLNPYDYGIEYPMISHPKQADSDGDDLTDLDETLIGTDPLLEDTDGDGLSDFVDEEPLTDNRPPDIELEAFPGQGYIRVQDDSKIQVDDIEVKPYFDPIYGPAEWKPENGNVAWAPTAENKSERPEYPHQFAYNIQSHGTLNERPQKYWINVTDESGKELNHLVDVEGSDVSLQRTTATTGAGAVVGGGTGSLAAPGVIVGIGVIAIALDTTKHVSDSGDIPEVELGLSVSGSVAAEWEDTAIGRVQLPEGHVSHNRGVTRGYGWAYISATSDVTKEEIGELLRGAEEGEETDIEVRIVSKSQQVTYIIGKRGPPDDTEIQVLKVVGGAVVSYTSRQVGETISSSETLDSVESFIVDKGGEGFRTLEKNGLLLHLLATTDRDTVQTYRDLSLSNKHEVGVTLANSNRDGWLSNENLKRYINSLESVEDVQGVESGPVQDLVDQGPDQSAIGFVREIFVASEIGSQNIKRVSLELNSGKHQGELDIQRESGDIIEVKSSFGYDRASADSDIENKLTTMREHGDAKLDGNTLTYRVYDIGNEEMLSDLADDWEGTIRSNDRWGNADIDIRFIDQNTGEVVAT